MRARCRMLVGSAPLGTHLKGPSKKFFRSGINPRSTKLSLVYATFMRRGLTISAAKRILESIRLNAGDGPTRRLREAAPGGTSQADRAHSARADSHR